MLKVVLCSTRTEMLRSLGEHRAHIATAQESSGNTRCGPCQTEKQSCSFVVIGVVNCHRDAWMHRSHILTPPTQLTGKSAKQEWRQEHTDTLNAMKGVVVKNTPLQCPDFNKKFQTHAGANDCQSSAVILQENEAKAFFSGKSSKSQQSCAVPEKELLATVDTLKEFQNTLLGHEIVVHTSQKRMQ